MHGGIMRIKFPKSWNGAKQVLVRVPGGVQTEAMQGNGILMTSTDVQASTGKDKVHSLRMFIRVEVEGGGQVNQQGGGLSLRGKKSQAMTTFVISSTRSETIARFSTSFLSHEQAKENMKQELDIFKDFDMVMNEARAEWNELLSRVEIRDSDDSANTYSHITTFYTALYRGLLFPRRLDEKTSQGRVVHWSPYATRRDRYAFPGPGVTDNGFWDTYRTVYPMLTLIYPDKIGSILEGWINAYREGGWLPKWASPGYRDSMVGTYCDVVLADAIVKGVDGFDVNAAYESMLKDADTNSNRLGTGRKFLNQYKSLGYVPKESGTESTSRTLDFAYVTK
jgi:predicted alpha-1,2-mannosidase